MIIFNLWSIPVGLIIYVAYLGVEHFFPALAADKYIAWTLGSLCTVIGALTERVGIKGRVFFLPIWVIGIGMIALQLGWIGWVILGVMAVLGFFWLRRFSEQQEAKEWAEAQAKLSTVPFPPTDSERAFWEWLSAVLYLPIAADYTPAVCDHDLKTLEIVKRVMLLLKPDEQARFDTLEQFLVAAKSMVKPPSVDSKVHLPMRELIEHKLSGSKKNKPLPTVISAAA